MAAYTRQTLSQVAANASTVYVTQCGVSVQSYKKVQIRKVAEKNDVILERGDFAP